MAGSATVGILRALLTADTAEFDAAMAGASAKTKVWSQDFTKLGVSAEQVGSVIVNSMERSLVSVDRLAKQFSGAGIAKSADEMAAAINRIPNGALGLTASEQSRVNAVMTEAIAKYQALGQTAPAHLTKLADATKQAATTNDTLLGSVTKVAGALGLAFSATAVISGIKTLVSNVFDAASAIHDQSSALGFSAEAFQRNAFAAEQSGGSIEAFTKAANRLNDNLANGSNSTVQALTRAGLQFDAIRNMSPEKAWEAVTDAVGKIEDPMTRASVAQDLFGKGALQLLPGMIEGYQTLGAAATVMSDATIQRLEAAQDSWDKFGKTVTIVTGEMVAKLMKFAQQNMGLKEAQDAAQASVNQFIALQPRHATAFTNLGASVKSAEAAEAAFTKANKGTETTVRASIKAYDDAQAKAKAYAASVSDLADAYTGKKLAAEIQKVSDAVTEAGKRGGLTAVEFEKLGKETDAFVAQGGRLTPVLSDLHLKWLQLHPVVVTSETDLAALNKTIGVTAVQLGKVPDLVTVLVQSLSRIPPVTIPVELGPPPKMTSADYFDFAIKGAKEAFAKIPDLLIASFTGGGNMAGALKAIGVQISAAIIEPLEKALSKVQKVAVGTGTALATALGQSAGLGSTTNTIIGVGTALAGTALAASAWGTSMAAAGVAGSVALGAATLGIGAAAVGIAMLIKHWKDHKKMVEENTKTINAFEQQMWQNLTAEQALEANGRTWAATNISVRDAYLATGRSAAEAEADIARLHAAAGQGAAQTQAAIDKINRAYIEQKQHTEALTNAQTFLDETVKKYGFTVEELGPKFRAQRLTEQAQALIQEYEALTASGIDVGLVTEKMTANVNDYLHMALKTGVEVPEAMRPMLEKMAEMGELTDLSGEKMDDLSGLTFGVTLTKGFQSVVDKLSELIHLLAGDLPDAAGSAAEEVTKHLGNLKFHVPVTFDVELPDMPSFPGEDTNGIPIFPQAEGGDYLVTRPTLFLAGEAGPERATFSGAGNLAPRGASGGAQTNGDVYVYHQTILDGRVIDERIEKVRREKMAQRKWPVPADAVRGKVPNG